MYTPAQERVIATIGKDPAPHGAPLPSDLADEL
ncbi:MAG: hypothetical protein RL550_1817, partial [Actinomycetota bacterium]